MVDIYLKQVWDIIGRIIMEYKFKLLLILLFTNRIIFSNLGRHDIDWENYEDFAMNNGKYSIGQQNVIVYKKNGSMSGKIEQPIPNFDGVVDKGNFALWGDSQILSGVTHIKTPDNFTFSKRHLRNDVELYDGYKASSSDEKYRKFSEKIQTNYRLDIGEDYSLIRTDKIAFDAYVTEGITQDDWDKIKAEDIVARVGAGYNRVAIGNNLEEYVAPLWQFAGGLNKISAKWKESKDEIDQIIYISIERYAKTALDSGTKPGDSGSPLFWWDKEKRKWLIASSNSGGNGKGYGKSSHLLSNPKFYEKWIKSLTDEEITNESNVEFVYGKLKVGDKERSFVEQGSKGKKNYIGSRVNKYEDNIDTKIISVKNQVFNKKGLNIDVSGNTDTGSARLEFKKDTILKGSGSLQTAGFVVHKGATLTYSLKFGENNIIRKIGEGKLIINSQGPNYGELNLGGGETELKNSTGVAASVIRLAQGAKLTINRADQISDSNVVFGHRGGTLNLNGNNLSFSDIYHMDKDAKIVNGINDNRKNKDKNTNDVKEATFTFRPRSGKRVFLGSFKGKLNLVYNPENANSSWSIRSEYTSVEGKFDIEKGHVIIEGDNVVHGYNKLVYEDEYKETKFKSESINIKSSSTLSINRAVKIETKIHVNDSSVLEVNALGTVKNILTPYTNAKTEKDINQILIKGMINFNSSSSTNFKANIQNNNEAKIDAELKGEINAIKKGNGVLYLSKETNSSLKGKINVEEGKLKISKKETLGSSEALLKNSSILEVENNETELKGIFDKIDKSSKGVLSLNKNISSIDDKYKEYSNLYLGSSKNITIGSEDKPINSNIKTLNLGGDNGTVTLKGISDTLNKLNIGDGVNKGTVIVDNKNKKEINTEIEVKKNANAEFTDGSHLKSVTNSGVIKLVDKDLKINKYTSNEGVFDIQLNEMNKKLLEIEKTNKNINVLLKIKDEMLNKIVNNDDERLNIAKISDKNHINILNLKEYDSVHELDIEKDNDNIVKLYSMIKGEVLGSIYMFNEIDLINNISSELKYRNVIEANYLNYNKIDKNNSKMKNTEYSNKIYSNGIEINFETSNNVKSVKISGGFSFNILSNNLITYIKNKSNNKGIIVNDFLSIATVPKIGMKYRYFDINLGFGTNIVLSNYNTKKDNLIYLNNSLNLGLNPEFKINKDISIKYLNRVGYRINALLNKTISKSLTSRYDISHNNPFNIYYESGIKLEHKYINFFTKANLEYNFSRYEIYNKGKSIENSFKDDWRVSVKTGFEFKPTDKIFINLDFDANIYQKSYGRYIFKLGTGYNW
ncbi:S6 family peptidase [Streptobacillus moniliformis]|uniref:S6 family peptidase n=1 Tax=Streptobacillus moniliformis TaxID=34105 RepID=UPI0007E4D419|nr:S6 family peptidase [Streptobacillus moniliformis]